MRLLLLDRMTIIERVPCPVCDARRGHSCWSRLLERAMLNEVHRERREAAAATQPDRSTT